MKSVFLKETGKGKTDCMATLLMLTYSSLDVHTYINKFIIHSFSMCSLFSHYLNKTSKPVSEEE